MAFWGVLLKFTEIEIYVSSQILKVQFWNGS